MNANTVAGVFVRIGPVPAVIKYIIYRRNGIVKLNKVKIGTVISLAGVACFQLATGHAVIARSGAVTYTGLIVEIEYPLVQVAGRSVFSAV